MLHEFNNNVSSDIFTVTMAARRVFLRAVTSVVADWPESIIQQTSKMAVLTKKYKDLCVCVYFIIQKRNPVLSLCEHLYSPPQIKPDPLSFLGCLIVPQTWSETKPQKPQTSVVTGNPHSSATIQLPSDSLKKKKKKITNPHSFCTEGRGRSFCWMFQKDELSCWSALLIINHNI